MYFYFGKLCLYFYFGELKQSKVVSGSPYLQHFKEFGLDPKSQDAFLLVHYVNFCK